MDTNDPLAPGFAGYGQPLRFNPGAYIPPVPVENPSVHPYPPPAAFEERKHRAEALVYESFLRAGNEIPGAHAFFSVTLPFSAARRRECDFLAVCPQGIAIVEVKGGLVGVDSVAGQSAYWKQLRLDGTDVGAKVSGAQIFTTTEALEKALADEAGVVVRNFAQIYVFPDTPRSAVADPRVLQMNDSPTRDFPRIVFRDEFERHGMWAIVAHELAMPGRAAQIPLDLRKEIATWAVDNTRAMPGETAERNADGSIGRLEDAPEELKRYLGPIQAPARETPRTRGDAQPRPGIVIVGPRKEEPFADAPLTGIDIVEGPRKPRRRWPLYAGLALAAVAIALLGRGGPMPSSVPAAAPPLVPVPSPQVAAAPAPAAQQASARPAVPAQPAPAPRPDPIQSALSRGAAMPPETKLAAGGSDWIRFLGPVANRAGCHMVEMSRAGSTGMHVACIRDDGSWSF